MCFDAASYGAVIVVDSEDNFRPEEVEKMHKDVTVRSIPDACCAGTGGTANAVDSAACEGVVWTGISYVLRRAVCTGLGYLLRWGFCTGLCYLLRRVRRARY
eukprot:1193975-Rhodomonas_salina.1